MTPPKSGRLPGAQAKRMKPVTLRSVLFRVILLCVLPLLLLSAGFAFYHVRSVQSRLDREISLQAQNTADAIDQFLRERITALEVLAASPSAADPARRKIFYERAKGFHETIGSRVILADAGMRMLLNTGVPYGSPLPLLPRPRGHSAAQEVLATGKPSVGDAFVGPFAGEPLYAVAVPLPREVEVRHLLLTVIPTRSLQEQIERISLPPGWELTVLDGANEPLARRAFTRKPGFPVPWGSGRRSVAPCAFTRWSVVLEVPPGVYRGPAVSAAAAFLAAILVFTLAGVLGGHRVARRLTRSVDSLVASPLSGDAALPAVAEVDAFRTLLDDASTARAAAESTVREIELRYRRLFDIAPIPLCVVRDKGTPIDANARFLQLFGYTLEKAPTIAEWWRAAYPDPAYRRWAIETWEAAVREAKRKGADIEPREYRLTCKSGDVRTMEISGIPLNGGFLATFFDVSDRKRSEETLRLHEHFLEVVGSMAQVGGWEFDPATGAGSWTEETARIHDLDPALPTSVETGLSYYRGEHRAKIEKAVREAVELGKPYDLELEMVTAKDVRKWVHTIGRPIVSDGKVVRMQGFMQDITDRKRAEEALEGEALRRKILIEHSRDGIVVLDENGAVFEANRRFAETLGYTPEEVLALHVWDWDGQWSREELLGMIERIDEAGDFLQTRHRRKDGALIDMEISTNGSVHGGRKQVFCVCRDITERVKAQAELAARAKEYRELSQEFHGLLDAIPDILMLLDRELKIRWANRACAETFGVAPESLPGRHCCSLLHENLEPCGECPVARTFESGVPMSVPLTTRGGRTWDARTVPLPDEAGGTGHVITVLRDVTEHSRLEAKYLHAQKMESIGTFAGGVAHDFNNILSAIIGYGHLTLAKMAPGDSVRTYVDGLLEAADRASHLTRDLLLFSRKQAGSREPVDLNRVVRKVEKFLRRVIGEDIECRVAAEPAQLWVLANANQLEQVIMNLATNARDAMPQGGVFSVTTGPAVPDSSLLSAHGFGTPGDYALLTVSDTGAGMDEETRKRIFEPFYTTKEVGKGTGLGLSVVYGIVEQHDGFVEVSSEPGKGTTFRIYLPIVPPAPPPEAAAPPPVKPERGTETILVAEDEEALRKLAERYLTAYGYTVILAQDGEDAVRIFRERGDAVRLLLFDLVMPRMNGKEALDEIRKIRPDVKVIFSSGYAPDTIRQKMELEEGVALIMKPFSPEDMLRKVREVLDG